MLDSSSNSATLDFSYYNDLCRKLFPTGVFNKTWDDAANGFLITSSVCFKYRSDSSVWLGFVVDDVLFVNIPKTSTITEEFNERVLSIIEFAENVLNCVSIVVSLYKTQDIVFKSYTRAFMYSGFELISPINYHFSSDYILLGYEI
ncbi:hypothetical protein BB561_000486 [Smittium simulii]|uniref:Ornithine decarboxylase antizyme n=1 Tax=Smittium simulii TaxID=133385 RepID=A0A2T9YYY7_9FUNG|nr:hypothetical protein BB561_000486 [Smittium simulii]